MEHPFQLRRATPGDKAAVTALAHAISADDYIPDEYDHWMAWPEPEGLYLAEQNGQVIGCYALEMPLPGEAYFYAMRVHPGVQGQGIGSLFCRAQVEQARSLGGDSIYLLSEVHNAAAHRTVQKNGFENRGEWIIYQGLPLLSAEAYDSGKGPQTSSIGASSLRARSAHESDRHAIHRFCAAHGLDNTSPVASGHSPWIIQTMTDGDWATERVALVSNEAGECEACLLWDIAEDEILLRALAGEPVAAAELITFAAREAVSRGSGTLSLSLPVVAESLLAPLRLDQADAFRAYVFHLPAGKPLPS